MVSDDARSPITQSKSETTENNFLGNQPLSARWGTFRRRNFITASHKQVI